MSGHSKWATTHRAKELADAKRGNIFTKLSRNISIAARKGGDPEMNFSLFTAIEKAKNANMPKDNIEKAIKRGTGELEGATLEQVMYEAFGSGGTALLIDGVTDNKNRTTSEVKLILTKHGGSFGAQNSVQWMFAQKGVIRLDAADVKDKDTLMMELLDAGAQDVVEEEGGLTVYTGFIEFEKVKKWLDGNGVKPSYAEVEWIAKDKVPVDEEARGKVESLIDALDAYDDVNGVYCNMA